MPLAGGRHLQVGLLHPRLQRHPRDGLAFVHYGVTIGDGAELTTDCFLMKGEQVPAGEHWGGNPAALRFEIRQPDAAGTAQAEVSGGRLHGRT